jgi:hypothetical protein
MENRPHIEEMPTGKDDPFRAWPGDFTLQTPLLLDAYRRMPHGMRFLNVRNTPESVHAHPIIIICGVVEILQTGLLSPYGEVPRRMLRTAPHLCFLGGVTHAS